MSPSLSRLGHIAVGSLALTFVLGGCLQRDWQECDGKQGKVLCPTGRVCAAGRCVAPRLFDVCADKVDGAPCITPTSETLRAVTLVVGGGAVALGDESTVLLLDGAGWRGLSLSGPGVRLNALLMDGESGLVGADGGLLVQLREGQLQRQQVGAAHQDVLTLWRRPGTRELWIGGSGGLLMRATDGRTFVQRHDLGAIEVVALWGDQDELLGLTRQGLLYTLDLETGKGSRRDLRKVISDARGRRFNGLWGRSRDELYVIGDQSLVLRFDGTRWAAMELPTEVGSVELRAISGNQHHVFVVGDGGTLLHLDGERGWSRETPYPPSAKRLLSVAAGSAEEGAPMALAVGEGGILLERLDIVESPTWITWSYEGSCLQGNCL